MTEQRRQFHRLQIKTEPFDVDLVFAPDGITNFTESRERSISEGIFRVANLRDIIASKRASGRQKNKIELNLLEGFRSEHEKRGRPEARPLRTSADTTSISRNQ